MTTAQFSWASDRNTLKTWGRPDYHPIPVIVSDLITSVYGTATYPPITATFAHPGILIGAPQISFVAGKLASSLNPWQDGYNKMMAARCDLPNSANNTRLYSDPSWAWRPWATLGRGSSGTPSEGDDDVIADQTAAYLNALRWVYLGDRAAAQRAIAACNAWSSTLTGIKFDTTTYSDGKLLAAWVGSVFPRVAELMRSTFTPGAGETVLDLTSFINMCVNIIYPMIKDGWTGGGANWLQSMAEATIAIGVLADSQTIFAKGIDNWRLWAPAMIWMNGDINRWPQLAGMPVSPAYTTYDKSTTSASSFKGYWYNPTAFALNGLEGESGRDPWHMSFGMSALVNGAETARLQGVDLYGEQQARIVAGFELNCGWLEDTFVNGINPPTTGGAWPFAGTWKTSNNAQKVPWEVGYNHYANRVGVPMPRTSQLLQDYVRPSGYRSSLMSLFETLTHYGTP